MVKNIYDEPERKPCTPTVSHCAGEDRVAMAKGYLRRHCFTGSDLQIKIAEEYSAALPTANFIARNINLNREFAIAPKKPKKPLEVTFKILPVNECTTPYAPKIKVISQSDPPNFAQSSGKKVHAISFYAWDAESGGGSSTFKVWDIPKDYTCEDELGPDWNTGTYYNERDILTYDLTADNEYTKCFGARKGTSSSTQATKYQKAPYRAIIDSEAYLTIDAGQTWYSLPTEDRDGIIRTRGETEEGASVEACLHDDSTSIIDLYPCNSDDSFISSNDAAVVGVPQDNPTQWTWSAEFDAGGRAPGTYHIGVRAEDILGNTANRITSVNIPRINPTAPNDLLNRHPHAPGEIPQAPQAPINPTTDPPPSYPPPDPTVDPPRQPRDPRIFTDPARQTDGLKNKKTNLIIDCTFGKERDKEGNLIENCDIKHLFELANNIMRLLIWVAITGAGVLIFFKGAKLAISVATKGGDQQARTEVQSALTAILWGLIFILSAYLIVKAGFTLIGYNLGDPFKWDESSLPTIRQQKTTKPQNGTQPSETPRTDTPAPENTTEPAVPEESTPSDSAPEPGTPPPDSPTETPAAPGVPTPPSQGQPNTYTRPANECINKQGNNYECKCIDCVETEVQCKESECKIHTSLEQKLQALRGRVARWRITEAWPPTTGHSNGCHYNGTCVDANFSPKSKDITKIKEFITAAEAVRLGAVYETQDASFAATLRAEDEIEDHNVLRWDDITDPHFSVYDCDAGIVFRGRDPCRAIRERADIAESN